MILYYSIKKWLQKLVKKYLVNLLTPVLVNFLSHLSKLLLDSMHISLSSKRSIRISIMKRLDGVFDAFKKRQFLSSHASKNRKRVVINCRRAHAKANKSAFIPKNQPEEDGALYLSFSKDHADCNKQV